MIPAAASMYLCRARPLRGAMRPYPLAYTTKRKLNLRSVNLGILSLLTLYDHHSPLANNNEIIAT